MLAYQISVGNELLIGDTVNTNATWIGQKCSELGIRFDKVITVPDAPDSLLAALYESMRDADLTILTGGLGPTHDDVTKSILLRFFRVGLVRHEPTLERIRRLFEVRGIPFTISNLSQADVPANCDVLENQHGTAPGMWFDVDGKILVVLPGVPREMKGLMNDLVIPRLKARLPESSLSRHYFQITGIGESTLSDIVIGDVSRWLSADLELAYMPNSHGITLRVTSFAGESVAFRSLVAHIRTTATSFIFSETADVTLEQVVVEQATVRNLSLATAESCTGGWVANLITNVPGSSAMFKGGIVAYDNSVKRNVLDVPESVLMEYGAVSKEVALIMAKSAAAKLGADIGISTTGVAGPSGGTDAKPVGLVWIGYWSEQEHFAVKARFFRDRLLNKERSAKVALEIVRRRMLGISGLPYDLEVERDS